MSDPSSPDDVVASDDEIRDSLPEDLDAVGYVGVYRFPDNARRRIPGVLYVLLGLAAIAGRLVVGDDSVLVNDGFVWGGAVLVAVGVYSFAAGHRLGVDEKEALVAATREVGFPVGHASAQMSWRGLLSRPTWRILLYSADDPPTQRGLVLVDGSDGTVIDHFIEDNPEDWDQPS